MEVDQEILRKLETLTEEADAREIIVNNAKFVERNTAMALYFIRS